MLRSRGGGGSSSNPTNGAAESHARGPPIFRVDEEEDEVVAAAAAAGGQEREQGEELVGETRGGVAATEDEDTSSSYGTNARRKSKSFHGTSSSSSSSYYPPFSSSSSSAAGVATDAFSARAWYSPQYYSAQQQQQQQQQQQGSSPQGYYSYSSSGSVSPSSSSSSSSSAMDTAAAAAAAAAAATNTMVNMYGYGGGGVGGVGVGKSRNGYNIPCKFYRAGNCANGKNCPYLHLRDDSPVCTFFLKGSCKFGNNCALPHVSSEYYYRKSPRDYSSSSSSNGGGGGGNGGYGRRVPRSAPISPPQVSPTATPTPGHVTYSQRDYVSRSVSLGPADAHLVPSFALGSDPLPPSSRESVSSLSSWSTATSSPISLNPLGSAFSLNEQDRHVLYKSHNDANANDSRHSAALQPSSIRNEDAYDAKDTVGMNHNSAGILPSDLLDKDDFPNEYDTTPYYFDPGAATATGTRKKSASVSFLTSTGYEKPGSLESAVANLGLRGSASSPMLSPPDSLSASKRPGADRTRLQFYRSSDAPPPTTAATHQMQTSSSYRQPGVSFAEKTKTGVENPYDPKNQQLCPFAMNGSCRYQENCRYLHGLPCPICGKCVLHPYRPHEHADHLAVCAAQEEDLDRYDNIQRSLDIECGICFEKVLSKPNGRFGLLNCDHPFCLNCIRSWRQNLEFESTVTHSCPICRSVTYFITPSSFWVTTGEEKTAIINRYKEKLRTIRCKYFNYGEGTCPFGSSCFYSHTYRDGTPAEPVVRKYMNGEEEVHFYGQIKLSDFIDARQGDL